jgi:hypothetical protein
MNKHHIDHNSLSTPPQLLPLLQRVKTVYILWISYYQILPKVHRYTLGAKIDSIFIDIIETISAASFLNKEEKAPYVRLAIRKTDTLKVLLLVLFETKSINDKKYIALSVPLEEIGRMLGGWNGQLNRQNK